MLSEHHLIIIKLFEMEVPEIYEVVRIETAARSRVVVQGAVSSRDPDVDPIGACVGMKGLVFRLLCKSYVAKK